MPKISVKKPFTILVLVAALIMLGFVSLSKMQMDLIPEINLPYILVITTYPGASPEKVETTISRPLESGLGTITGVKNITSISYENYSLVQLEFEDDTDMDAVMVKVSTAIDAVKAYFPDEVGVPNIMELGTDMLASQYLAIGYEGKSMEELSKFVESTVVPEIERQGGVADINSLGLIEKTVQVELKKDKVDILNGKIKDKANDSLDEAAESFDDAKEQLEDAEKQLADSKQQLVDSQNDLNDAKQELIDGQAELNDGKAELADNQKKLDDNKKKLDDGQNELDKKSKETYDGLAAASKALDDLQTYQSLLLSQQASVTALDAAIGIVDNGDGTALNPGLTSVESNLNLIAASKGTFPDVTAIESAITSIESLESNLVGSDDDAIGSGLASALTTAGFSVSDSTTFSEAKLLLSTKKGELQGLKTLYENESTLIAAKNTYESNKQAYIDEKSALQVEIAATEAVIAGYETELKKYGMSYTDIETAKLQAAAGFASADAQLAVGKTQLDSAQTQLDSAKTQLDDAQKQLDDGWTQINDGQNQINDGWTQIKDGEDQIIEGWDNYYDGLDQFEVQKEQALRQANANQLLTLETLASIIYAQNFSMPAGYIDDVNDNSWLLKIGDNFANVDDLKNMVLVNIDGIGDVKLGDVAEITIIDNSSTTYTRLNGNPAVILSVFKASTSGTNEVSKQVASTVSKLETNYPGLNIMVMMDQGEYIDIIVGSVVSNMVIGAALAIIILAIFLKDFLPTIVVAISIPLSVLLALVAMYFSGISLNMMSLSGMALGIGMLVDNSIVVIENIYRLRGRGVEAPRAAVQGTKQVAGAVIASTLTTVCVFLPMVYTTGLVRELMLPMALTICYCLLASLLIAMTVVPAASSTLLRRTKPKSHPLFDKIQDIYGEALRFCLKVKAVPLLVAAGLLALSIWQVVRMGIVVIPDMTSNQIEGTVTFPEGTTREAAYAAMDEYLLRASNIKGIDSIGVMTGDGSAMIASVGDSDSGFLQYTIMVTAENEKAGADEIKRIMRDLEACGEGLNVTSEYSAGMGDMSALFGSGMSVTIYGDDLDTLVAISEDVMGIFGQVDGFVDISNGQEDADQVLHLNIDRDYAMSKGLSIAQIYQTIATKITTETDSVSIVLDGEELKVKIVTGIDPLTVENLMDYNFEVTEKDDWDNDIKVDMPLGSFATVETQDGYSEVSRKNNSRYITVTASAAEGENLTLLSRKVEPLLNNYVCPDGYSIDVGGESETVNEMVSQMALLMLMGSAFIYFVMVAQFQSLLSPFIVLFTLPLAFTGGLLILWFTGEQISIISIMGFVVLLGTVVNNGIVFVDYANQLRIGGMKRRDALVATGKTRMRPILMTALTTILAESSMIFGDDMGSQMGRGMALVIAGGLAYSTLMTLFIIPVMYDILFKKAPLSVDVGSENLDDIPDDAAEFMAEMIAKKDVIAQNE